MKITKLAAIGILIVWWMTGLSNGQVSSFQATVPFPFVVGSQTLPAGSYSVQRYLGRPKSADDTAVIVIKAGDHHIYKVIVTSSNEVFHASRSDQSRLIFGSFKGKQYLNRIWIAGDAVAHQLANVPSEIVSQGATGEVIVTGVRYSKSK